MESHLNLLEETKGHFNEGARMVRAYTNDVTYIITRSRDNNNYSVTTEESGFEKINTQQLDDYFKDVFGIEALY